MYQAAARADYDIGEDTQLTSLTSFSDSRFNQITDDDGTTIPDTTVRYSGKARSFYQEVRLTGKAFEGKFNYIVGGNYQKDSISESELVETPGYSALPPQSNFDARYDLTNRAIAAFANGDFALTSALTFSAGVRYTETRQTMTGCTRDTGNGNAAAVLGGLSNLLRSLQGLPPTTAFVAGGCVTLDNLGPVPTYLPSFTNIAQKQHNLAWRGSLNYKPSRDVLLYGSVSRGFKSGIFPVQVTIVQAGINPVSQEELTAYEVGVKAGVLGNRLHFDAAVFYYDYKNKQFLTFVPVPPIGTTSTLVNIPKSKVKGIEAGITATPIDGLTARASLTYIKTSVGPYQSFNLLAQLVDFQGKEFNYAPPLSINADIEYKWPISDSLSALIGGGANHNDRTYGDLGEQAFNLVPGFTIFDARVGLESQKGWKASLWMRNLTNKYYLTSVTPGNDANLKFAGMPRTFGITLGAKF
jgi:outer membrane receptor protein involved in Fe transport